MENSITNTESDTRANLNTDHFPLIFATRIKLKSMKAGGKGRPMYKPCNENENSDLNYELWNSITTNQNPNTSNYNVIKHWLKNSISKIPTTTPKDKNKRFELSKKSLEILENRKKAAKNRNIKESNTLTREFGKSRKEDKKEKNTRSSL